MDEKSSNLLHSTKQFSLLINLSEVFIFNIQVVDFLQFVVDVYVKMVGQGRGVPSVSMIAHLNHATTVPRASTDTEASTASVCQVNSANMHMITVKMVRAFVCRF